MAKLLSDDEYDKLVSKAAWHDTHPDNAGVPHDPFLTDLQEVINKHSKENDSDTADFVLASYLKACLETWNYHIGYRNSLKDLSPEVI